MFDVLLIAVGAGLAYLAVGLWVVLEYLFRAIQQGQAGGHTLTRIDVPDLKSLFQYVLSWPKRLAVSDAPPVTCSFEPPGDAN